MIQHTLQQSWINQSRKTEKSIGKQKKKKRGEKRGGGGEEREKEINNDKNIAGTFPSCRIMRIGQVYSIRWRTLILQTK